MPRTAVLPVFLPTSPRDPTQTSPAVVASPLPDLRNVRGLKGSTPSPSGSYLGGGTHVIGAPDTQTDPRLQSLKADSSRIRTTSSNRSPV